MKYFLLLLISLMIISCDDSETKFECSSCKDDQVCNEAEKKCETKTEVCTNAETKCEADKLLTCEDNTWKTLDCTSDNKVCRVENSLASCIEELEACVEGETKCNVNNLLTCEKSAWLSLDCTASNKICETNATTSSSSCVEEVVACTNDATKCVGDKLSTCVNDNWETTDCPESKVCKEENNIALCVEDIILDGTIYPIRKGEVAEDTEVSVRAFVTGVKLDNTSKIEGFFIQELGSNYRGIYVYAKTRLDMTLVIGDEVTVTGIYKEYNDLSEIVVEAVTQVVKTDVNTPIVDFKLISLDDLVNQRMEEYESMLVTIKGRFTVGTRDASFNLQIKDENNSVFLIKDDFDTIDLSEGDKLSEIRGVLTYNYSKFKILPRGVEDLIDNSAVCSQVSCGTGELCEVNNEIPSCVCDTMNGYFVDTNGECKNPCTVDGVCIEENKHQCSPSDATNFTCSCDAGFEEDTEGVCGAVPYCDSATYSSAFGLTGSELADALKVIVDRTYDGYGYDDGRIAMFSYIDNDNGTIKCIYTGENASHPYVDDFSLLNENDTDKPENAIWNWEHTWPSSQLSSSAATSDLHHLFPTRAYVNSKRSNLPFGNVSGGELFCDDGNNGPGTCAGYDYVSELKSGVFEVADQHKGNTARAMFYMLIRYKEFSQYINTSQFIALKGWHTFDPVDEKDRDRNNKVELFQHNRNPFVDCPQFVDALYE